MQKSPDFGEAPWKKIGIIYGSVPVTYNFNHVL